MYVGWPRLWCIQENLYKCKNSCLGAHNIPARRNMPNKTLLQYATCIFMQTNTHLYLNSAPDARPAYSHKLTTVAIHLRHVTHQLIHTPTHDLFSLLNANPRHPPTSNTQNLANKYIFIFGFCISRTAHASPQHCHAGHRTCMSRDPQKKIATRRAILLPCNCSTFVAPPCDTHTKYTYPCI